MSLASAISTHAPRTGSDSFVANDYAAVALFQPTLPARGATTKVRYPWTELSISTHAPRTGSDRYYVEGGRIIYDFNPRSPHGERRWHNKTSGNANIFQPTLPARGATPSGSREPAGRKHFNPRSPHGERLVECVSSANAHQISTHAPRTGSDIVADRGAK